MPRRRQRRKSRGIAERAWYLLLLALIVASVVAWRQGPFRDSLETVTPEVPTGSGVRGVFVEPDDGRAPVLDEIEYARTSIDVMVYLLTDDEVVAGLLAAEERDVEVRVLLEQYPYGGFGNPEQVAAELRAGGIEVRWASHEFTFSHVKTIIVDRETALIMNLNLTESAFRTNREFGVVTSWPGDVAAAQAAFDADWDGHTLTSPGPLVISPLNSRLELLHLIESATRSLDIYAEVVRDGGILGGIFDALERGVRVRLVVSPDEDPSDHQILLDLAAAGVAVRLVERPYIHAKLLIADGSTAFVGSQNLTETSLDENREIGIMLREAELIARLQRVFESDVAASEPLAGPLAHFVVHRYTSRHVS